MRNAKDSNEKLLGRPRHGLMDIIKIGFKQNECGMGHVVQIVITDWILWTFLDQHSNYLHVQDNSA